MLCIRHHHIKKKDRSYPKKCFIFALLFLFLGVFWLIDRFIYSKCVQYVLQNRVYSLWSNGKGVDFMVWNMYAVRENEKLKYGKNQSKTLINLVDQNKKGLI